MLNLQLGGQAVVGTGFDLHPLTAEGRVAGSAYELPFRDGRFSHVLSYHVLNHIRFDWAIKEAVRVLRPQGEIRHGQPCLQAIPSRGIMLNGRLRYDGGAGETYFEEITEGINEGFEWLAGQRDLAVYAVLGDLPTRSEIRGMGVYTLGNLIIRNDGVLPRLGRVKFPLQEKYPLLGKMYRIKLDKYNVDDDWHFGYWPMEPVN